MQLKETIIAYSENHMKPQIYSADKIQSSLMLQEVVHILVVITVLQRVMELFANSFSFYKRFYFLPTSSDTKNKCQQVNSTDI
jgi:hypothetical protein